jgi:hypothetical protein
MLRHVDGSRPAERLKDQIDSGMYAGVGRRGALRDIRFQSFPNLGPEPRVLQKGPGCTSGS